MKNIWIYYWEGLRGKNNGEYLMLDEMMEDFYKNWDKEERVLKFKATIGTHIIEEWIDAHTMKCSYEAYLISKLL